jgi:hypothetical protein
MTRKGGPHRFNRQAPTWAWLTPNVSCSQTVLEMPAYRSWGKIRSDPVRCLTQSWARLLASPYRHQARADAFARAYSERELSAGQHLLMMWALLLHEHNEQFGIGSVAFLDEPERHHLRNRVDYFAFNESGHDSHADECAHNVRLLHPDNHQHHVSNEISDFFGESQVDIVVMSNFLHDIEPRSWGIHFRTRCPDPHRRRCLSLNGRSGAPCCELLTENGLILLDLTATRILFGHTTAVRSLGDDGRLTAFEIPRCTLAAYTDTCLREALVETSSRAARELEGVRQGKVKGTQQGLGRRHALLALLFASTELTLCGMPESAPPSRQTGA